MEGKMVLRTLQSGMGRENSSLGFQIKIFSNGSFSFLVDFPLVQVLGFHFRLFFDFGLEIWFSSENSGLEIFGFRNSEFRKKHKFCSALGIQDWKYSALEIQNLETNVLTEYFFFSFVDSALETEM
ncbi:hypothetical protein C1645_835115 [Glomus cerebriforme]|uniref:Uncharacterized protein n=1 Tax=Glomus cerebriforme TaxID=658196 RepID=A0A397SII0_9GLOM|nr:hypothetical protein C1645_835115 [Glomus cerebriforme]